MVKATYGTGSSIMMNIGETPVFSDLGVVTSLAWSMGGKVNYVLEGNINYTGAVISWLQNDLKLIESAKETEELAKSAHPQDKTYLVPAFSGLGAPYWDSKATAIICGMTRTTGKAEVVKAALDCIAYQITDIIRVMSEASGVNIEELRVDGGPTRNGYLMQFQSDLLGIPVRIPDSEELSGIGAAYAAGLSAGIYDQSIFGRTKRDTYLSRMEETDRESRYDGWKEAVQMVRGRS
jgi:glycerol kinase